jgi:hypothetical protein
MRPIIDTHTSNSIKVTAFEIQHSGALFCIYDLVQSPRHLDYTYSSKVTATKSLWKTLYHVEGDRLIISGSARERPKELKLGNGGFYFVWERVKP